MKAIWHGGFIYTMLKEGDRTEAVYVEDGVIKGTGSYERLKEKYGSPETEDISLNGAVMFPGFVDSHLHLIGHGEKQLQLDLSALTSKDAILQAAKERERQLPKNDWLIGEGWNENLFETPDYLTKHDLDRLFSQACLAQAYMRHAIAVNSAALQAAGISRNTPDPDGGVIVKDANGEPSGLLFDKAQDLILKAVPPVSQHYVDEALTAAIKDCWTKGLTGGHSEDLSYYGDVSVPMKAYEKLPLAESIRFAAICSFIMKLSIDGSSWRSCRARMWSSVL